MDKHLNGGEKGQLISLYRPSWCWSTLWYFDCRCVDPGGKKKKAFVYLTPNSHVLHSKVLYTLCISAPVIRRWNIFKPLFNVFITSLCMFESQMLFQSWRRLHERTGPVVWTAPLEGDTDKRFSFLSVMLMMSVCSDVCVCVWPVLLPICRVCVFKLCLMEGGRCLL